MNITEAMIKELLGQDESSGVILLNLRLNKGGIEVGLATTGGLAKETLRPLGEAAAKAVMDTLRKLDGCQCPECQAAKALSHHAPTAEA